MRDAGSPGLGSPGGPLNVGHHDLKYATRGSNRRIAKPTLLGTSAELVRNMYNDLPEVRIGVPETAFGGATTQFGNSAWSVDMRDKLHYALNKPRPGQSAGANKLNPGMLPGITAGANDVNRTTAPPAIQLSLLPEEGDTNLTVK